MTAIFVDLGTGKAVRIAAKESSKALTRNMHPEIENKNQQQMLAHLEMPADHLFAIRVGKGYPSGRRVARIQRRPNRLLRLR
jgi:hypothetical protein